MKRILVGYDGSEAARHALDQAGKLATAYGAPVTVLTAANDRMVREDGVVTMALDESHAQWTANQGAERLRAAGVANVDTCISLEAPLHALTEAAKEGYDLLVVGHRGHSLLEEMFLGSTAKSIVDQVECSVLIVR